MRVTYIAFCIAALAGNVLALPVAGASHHTSEYQLH
jgi:hypothetical protein